MQFDSTFWVAVSFVLFCVLVAKPVGRAMGAGLDGRADKIKSELDEAMRLKEESQAVLALYQRKQKKTIENSQEIIAHAKSEAERIIESAKNSLKEDIKKRTELALQKISQAETRVIEEIRDNAVDITVSAAKTLIIDNLNKEISDEIINTAIGDLGRKFH